MKTLRILGMSLIAAAALAAVLGAGTASATVLCEEAPAAGTHCKTPVNKGTVVTFSIEAGTSSLLKGPFGETIATCTESTLKSPTSNVGSTTEAVSGNIETMTFSSCNRPVTVFLLGTIRYFHINGTLYARIRITGLIIIIHNVPLFGSCTYETNETEVGTLTGNTSSAPTLDIGGSIKSTNGCPTATWSGSYVYTGSTNFAVSAG